MAGFDVLNSSSTVLCMHGGKANLTKINPRVKVMGAPTYTAPCPVVVAGCAFPPPPAANGPCVSATISMGAVRVKSMGMPVVVGNPGAFSAAVTVTSGTPLQYIAVPTRVKAM